MHLSDRRVSLGSLIVVMSLARIRLLIVAVALLSAAVSVPAFSQKFGPDRAPNLTTSVIDERTLVMQVPRIEERVDIPDTTAGVLIEPAGRTWNCFHEVLLHLGAAILLLDTIVLLAAAYLIIGQIRISAGRSGKEYFFRRRPQLGGGHHASGPSSKSPRTSADSPR
jgi:formate dehydrogenase subunit gamma